MNSIKPICLSAFTILVLAGCGAQKQVSSFSQAVMHTQILKKQPKENELQRWVIWTS
jgi:uncharacterized protein YcfL